MRYDLKNPLHREQFKARANQLFKAEKMVDLVEKKPIRSIQQNKYLHTILSYFGLQTGNDMEYVKREYFKKLINPLTFKIKIDDKFLGEIEVLRSSATLTTEEMTLCIERFRNWAADNGIYIPSPEEHMLIEQMEIEIERNKTYL